MIIFLDQVKKNIQNTTNTQNNTKHTYKTTKHNTQYIQHNTNFYPLSGSPTLIHDPHPCRVGLWIDRTDFV
jgi:hypothetical protein